MVELEQKVAELEQQNRRLCMDNERLKSESGKLQKQNEQLKERLGALKHDSGKTEAGIGSAASAGLQQQGQTLPLSYLSMYTLSILTYLRYEYTTLLCDLISKLWSNTCTFCEVFFVSDTWLQTPLFLVICKTEKQN